MLFVITLLVFVGTLITAIIANHKDEFGAGALVAAIAAIVSGIVLIIMLFVLAFAYIGLKGDIAALDVRYGSLVTQYENEYYENDNDVGKKELIKEIQEWNEDLSYRKIMQRNVWVGIFYPNIYDDYELIPLK